MASPILAIDPGNHGAAVLVIDGAAHRALVWSRVASGLRVREWSRTGALESWVQTPGDADAP